MSLVAVMETNKGTIRLDLYAEETPMTVANFVNLAQRGFYDGLSFHRVIADFMIQGGCPHSKDPMSRRAGTGGPGWQIPCERSALAIKHDKPGILSMANRGPNTNGSQFFITYGPQPHLDNMHSVFGKVVEGIELIEAIPPRDPSMINDPSVKMVGIEIREN